MLHLMYICLKEFELKYMNLSLKLTITFKFDLIINSCLS